MSAFEAWRYCTS